MLPLAKVITRNIAKGTTAFFDPIMDFDAKVYQCSPIVCTVTMQGDLTPSDNSMSIAIP